MCAAVWHPSGLSNRSGIQRTQDRPGCNGGFTRSRSRSGFRPPTGRRGSLPRRAVGTPSSRADRPRRRRRRRACSRAAWYRALASVRLEMVQPGVARLWGSPRTRQQRYAAAVLSIGRGVVASHRSAAFLWGVERLRDDPVDLVLARNQRVPGARRCRGPPPDRSGRPGAVIRDGIAVTNPLRMLCDLAAVDPTGIRPLSSRS